tara:strand:+ start:3794 stop:4171 length:378 start_codon:yes stop_codon:yes gene_type:complete
MPTIKGIEPPPAATAVQADDGNLDHKWFQWLNEVWDSSAKIETYERTLTPLAIPANSCTEVLFTVTGVITEDLLVACNKPTATANIGIVGFRVSAENQVGVTYINNSGGIITPPEEAYRLCTVRL